VPAEEAQREEGNASAPIDPGAFQAQILADGDVTPAELERALQASVQCQRNHGLEAELVSFDPSGRIVRTASAAGDDPADLDKITEDCDGQYLTAVLSRYGELHPQSEEELQRELDAYIACLGDRGLDVKGLNEVEISERVPAADAMACSS
jgi:hypothetical protein